MKQSWLFKLRGPLSKAQHLTLGVLGIALFLLIWVGLTSGESPMVSSGILANPFKVLNAYGELYRDNELIKNMTYSIGLNLAGYVKAISISIVLGFAIGLVPLLRGLFQGIVEAFRFVPLTAVTGLFIVWFGIQTGMKVNFLAFGILIYLLPVVVQRIDEVEDVYLKTVYTLGASNWQTIRTVYMPSVFSRIFDDIRILTAISWTYIIVAEMVASQGGIGALIFSAGRRQGRVDKTFALLILIIMIGILQDRIFKWLDREFFPHKYQVKNKYGPAVEDESIGDSILSYTTTALVWIMIGLYCLFFLNEYIPVLGDIKILSFLFKDTLWAIHIIFLAVVVYKAFQIYTTYRDKEIAPAKTVKQHG